MKKSILIFTLIGILVQEVAHGQTNADSLANKKFRSFLKDGDSCFVLKKYYSAKRQYSFALDIKPADSIALAKLNKANQACDSLCKPVFEPCGKFFNSKKQIVKNGCFKCCELIEGVEYIYDSNDKLIQIKAYKNGIYVGDQPLRDQAQLQTDIILKKDYYDFYTISPNDFSIFPKKSISPATVNIKFSFNSSYNDFLYKSYFVSKDTTINGVDYYTIKITIIRTDKIFTCLEGCPQNFDLKFPFLTAGYYKIEFEKGDRNVGFDLGSKSYFTVNK